MHGKDTRGHAQGHNRSLISKTVEKKKFKMSMLTRKTVFLMVLVSAKRVKALSNLLVSPGLLELTPESVRFTPVKLDKHRLAYLIQPLRIKRFEDRDLDLVCHLKVYLRRTR